MAVGGSKPAREAWRREWRRRCHALEEAAKAPAYEQDQHASVGGLESSIPLIVSMALVCTVRCRWYRSDDDDDYGPQGHGDALERGRREVGDHPHTAAARYGWVAGLRLARWAPAQARKRVTNQMIGAVRARTSEQLAMVASLWWRVRPGAAAVRHRILVGACVMQVLLQN